MSQNGQGFHVHIKSCLKRKPVRLSSSSSSSSSSSPSSLSSSSPPLTLAAKKIKKARTRLNLSTYPRQFKPLANSTALETSEDECEVANSTYVVERADGDDEDEEDEEYIPESNDEDSSESTGLSSADELSPNVTMNDSVQPLNTVPVDNNRPKLRLVESQTSRKNGQGKAIQLIANGYRMRTKNVPKSNAQLVKWDRVTKDLYDCPGVSYTTNINIHGEVEPYEDGKKKWRDHDCGSPNEDECAAYELRGVMKVCLRLLVNPRLILLNIETGRRQCETQAASD